MTKGRSVKGTILGQAVYNEKDERVGSVEDIIVTPDKAISYGIINAGGFLGLTKTMSPSRFLNSSWSIKS